LARLDPLLLTNSQKHQMNLWEFAFVALETIVFKALSNPLVQSGYLKQKQHHPRSGALGFKFLFFGSNDGHLCLWFLHRPVERHKAIPICILCILASLFRPSLRVFFIIIANKS
jgi:hypothetical protein